MYSRHKKKLEKKTGSDQCGVKLYLGALRIYMYLCIVCFVSLLFPLPVPGFFFSNVFFFNLYELTTSASAISAF